MIRTKRNKAVEILGKRKSRIEDSESDMSDRNDISQSLEEEDSFDSSSDYESPAHNSNLESFKRQAGQSIKGRALQLNDSSFSRKIKLKTSWREQFQPQGVLFDEKGSNNLEMILSLMIDERNVDWISNSKLDVDSKLKMFLALIVRISSDVVVDTSIEDVNDFVKLISSNLRSIPLKRKDQRLRMVFNGILKILINEQNHDDKNHNSLDCKCNQTKLEIFLERFGNSDKESLRTLIEDCRVPSRRRLKGIFIRYPSLKQEIVNALKSNAYLNNYLKKRAKRVKKICDYFHRIYHEKPKDPDFQFYSLKEYVKSFPWSTKELKESCDLLQSIVVDSNMANPVRLSDEVMKMKFNFIMEGFASLNHRLSQQNHLTASHTDSSNSGIK